MVGVSVEAKKMKDVEGGGQQSPREVREVEKEREKLEESLKDLEVVFMDSMIYSTESRRIILVNGEVHNKVKGTRYHCVLWLDPRTLFPVRFTCECPDFTFRIRMCKHLFKLYREYISRSRILGRQI